MLKIVGAINELTSINLEFDVQITSKMSELSEYANEISLEPYLINTASGFEVYKKKEWTSINSLKDKLSNHNSVLGIKFISSEEHIDWLNENEDEKELRLQRRKECFKIIKPILNYFKNLKYLDLSEMGLNNYDIEGIKLDKIEVLNLRQNNFNDLSFTIPIEKLFIGNFMKSSLKYYPVVAENLIVEYSNDLYKLVEEKKIVIKSYLSIFMDENKIDLIEFKKNSYRSKSFEGIADLLILSDALNFRIVLFSQSSASRIN